MRELMVIGCGMVMATAAHGEPLRYPAAPRGEVVDDYFGTKVADPYRWLEALDSPQTRAWAAAENLLSLPYLKALPQREAFRKRLEQLWNYERFDLPRKRGGKLFYGRNDGLQNQSVLYVQDKRDAKPRELLDPNLLSADGTVALALYAPSPDGELLAYATATAGSDWNEFRVRRVEDATDTGDVLSRIKFSGISWTHDSKGFFYARFPAARSGDAPATFDELAHQKLYYHRLGSPQADDLLIAEMPDQAKWTWDGQVTDDGRYLVVFITQGTGDETAVWVKDLVQPDAPEFDAGFIKLVDHFSAEYHLLGNLGSTLYFRSNQSAPLGRVVAVDLAQPNAGWRTIVAEQADTLQSALFAGNEIIALTMHDATSRLLRYALDGKPLGEIALPGLGSVPDLAVGGVQLSGSVGDPNLFYGYTSFNTPLTHYVYDVGTHRTRVFQPLKLDFSPDDYVTEEVFCKSKDGTRIPLFISYRKGVKRDGRNPTLLYGYGGFNISRPPEFSVSNLVWMDRGGVYAQAVLRGGGEYGRAWHEAGTLDRKQNVFDDFAAAAQYLIHEQWTAPAHLAITGRSNGGLLIGATVNQHPELFAAALPAVGVMDMLRYQKFTIGWAWAGDYGTSDTEAGFRNLYPYSPYHNVKPGVKYPAVLATTGDHDDRVMPAHSFKYIAALQAATSINGIAGSAPALIRIDSNAGHGGGKPISKLIEEEADKLAFAWHFTQ